MGPSAAGPIAETLGDLFDRAIADDPTRPLITWYDDATGERVELSGTTLDNWTAKTANLLVDGCGLGHGDRAAVLLPPHWQAAAVLLGCWRAGLEVITAPIGARPTSARPASAGPASARPADAAPIGAEPAGDGPVSAGPVDVLFAVFPPAEDDLPSAGERFVLGLAPLGAPLPSTPDGFIDYIAEVRGHGDRFDPYRAVEPAEPAMPGRQHRDLCAAATRRAAALGIGVGARVLIDAAAHPEPLDWLLAPLAAGASTVLCGRLDPAALPGRIDAERVTVVPGGAGGIPA